MEKNGNISGFEDFHFLQSGNPAPNTSSLKTSENSRSSCKSREMEEPGNDSGFWKNLKTLTIFDRRQNNLVGTSKKKQYELFSASSLLIESLIEYICTLIEKDDTSQRQLYITICRKLNELNLIDESYLVSDFDFIRNHYQRELYRLVIAAKSVISINDYDNASVPVVSSTKTTRFNSKLFEWSRYTNEYYELEFIARGGFGEVVKVQNKLDTGIYAMKKICLKYCSINGFIRGLSEVQMLAKLNHPNIVSYKAAWLEPLLKEQKLTITKDSTTVICSREKSESQKDDSSDVIFAEPDQSKRNERSYTVSISSGESPLGLSHENIIDVRNLTKFYKSHKSSCDFNVLKFRGKTRRVIHECGQDWAILFIQMQLCHQTLKRWLDQRNSVCSRINIQESLRIFLQIVRGVEFIHSKGIVHHDIKPNNIFISQDSEEVQVGDFGLSCCLLHDTYPDASATIFTSPNCPVTVEHRPGEIGTKLYAAPEQLNGVCDYKSDLFSSGILLFELIYSFQTDMERIEKINNLRKGKFPSDLDDVVPNIVTIIKQLINPELNARPTASELLKEITDLYRNLNVTNGNDSEIVKLLREEISNKNEEIRILKERLLSLQNSC